MRFSYVFGDEQSIKGRGAKNTFLVKPIPSVAHPSSPINYIGNCQAGAFFISWCIPSPPSEDAPLDITVVDCGNAHHHFADDHFFLPLSTISPSANDKQLLTENNMKITSKVLCLGVLV